MRAGPQGGDVVRPSEVLLGDRVHLGVDRALCHDRGGRDVFDLPHRPAEHDVADERNGSEPPVGDDEHHHADDGEQRDADEAGDDAREEGGQRRHVGVATGQQLARGAVAVEREVGVEHVARQLLTETVGDAPCQRRRPPRDEHGDDGREQPDARIAETERGDATDPSPRHHEVDEAGHQDRADDRQASGPARGARRSRRTHAGAGAPARPRVPSATSTRAATLASRPPPRAVIRPDRQAATFSRSGFTSEQNRSIVRFASSNVMSPVGICSTM